jgi:transposase
MELDFLPSSHSQALHPIEAGKVEVGNHVIQPCADQIPVAIDTLALGIDRPDIYALQAALLVARYSYGLSLHELVRRETAAGQDASRKQLSSLIRRSTERLLPLAQAIRNHGLQAPLLTAANIAVPNRGGGTRRLWGYVSSTGPSEEGQARPYQTCWFQVTPDRSIYAKTELRHYGGMVQASPSTGYEGAVEGTQATLIHCWGAVASRTRLLALAEPHPILSAVLEAYDQLRQNEKEIRKASLTDRAFARHTKSRPILRKLHDTLERARQPIAAFSSLANYLADLERHWPSLCSFIEHPAVEMENGALESRLKSLAERDPWIFTWHPQAPTWAAAIFTILESCALNRIDAENYIAEALQRIEHGEGKDPHREAILWGVPFFRSDGEACSERRQ